MISVIIAMPVIVTGEPTPQHTQRKRNDNPPTLVLLSLYIYGVPPIQKMTLDKSLGV
jgi:hypothetical protein